ncbi:AMIN-like domain-containing (lipo)protein [Nonomuraea zeae]|uniref:AMIN-like domain-containing protein n=1 Tax=Nonomuraea zeae TaxID=1642303 RepID=A0A5S4FYY9_9ACTN|nr:hypothetical protein [Nonomuraea zeae]TMR25943.1 hypothetical protein ETD85_44185 [Nonomuraea zeae]
MRSSSPPGLRSARSRAAALLACLAVLTACGTVQQTALPGTSATTGSPAESGAGRGTPGPGAPTSTTEVDVERDGIEPATVTAVRYAAHDTYDRVVVDLKGGVPGYTVKWADELMEDASGQPIDVHGGAYLQLTLFPANAHDDDGAPTWAGGPIYPAKLTNLTDVVRTGDFEGRVGIGLVLARKAGFQVKEQGGPSRLVIDVAH